jgi:hypothetical protein
MAKKKSPKIVQMLSPENYIRQKARSLPIYKCFINKDWESNKMVTIIVSRRHTNGNLTLGLYLVDLLCLGVKDSYYQFNIPESEMDEMVEKFDKFSPMKPVDYTLAHNFVYAAVEFAERFEFHPHKDFTQVTQYILEEDDENTELIDIECGEKGKPMFVQGQYDDEKKCKSIIAKLERTAGTGNFHFCIIKPEGEFEFSDNKKSEGIEIDDDKEWEEEDEFDDEIDEDELYEEDDKEEEGEMSFSEACSILNSYKNKADINQTDTLTIIEAVNRICFNLIDEKELSELYKFYSEDFDFDILDNEIPDELIGLPAGAPPATKEQKKIFWEITKIYMDKPRKAYKLFERLKKQLPPCSGLAFLELLFIPGDSKFQAERHEKVKYYHDIYPGNPLINIMWLLVEAVSQDENILEKVNIKPLKELFPHRKSLHILLFSTYLDYCTSMILFKSDLARLEALMEVIENLNIDEDVIESLNNFYTMLRMAISVKTAAKMEN